MKPVFATPEFERDFRDGQKIRAIKHVREITKLGLYECKILVDECVLLSTEEIEYPTVEQMTKKHPRFDWSWLNNKPDTPKYTCLYSFDTWDKVKVHIGNLTPEAANRISKILLDRDSFI